MNCKLCKRLIQQRQGRNRTRCNSCNTKIRRFRLRKAAIKYLGGKCQGCGWIGHQAGYDFHHIDPSQKDFEIATMANKKWEVIKAELDKCKLLCAICHRLEHSSKEDEAFLEEVESYRGRDFGSIAQ